LKKKYHESLENSSIGKRVIGSKKLIRCPAHSDTSIKQDAVSPKKNLTLSISKEKEIHLPKLNFDSPLKKSYFESMRRNSNPDAELKNLLSKASAVEAFFLSENSTNDQTIKAMQKEISLSSRKYKEKRVRVRVENADIVDFLK
jgi:hypothetical protein